MAAGTDAVEVLGKYLGLVVANVALTVDPEAKRRMLGLARKVETEVGESWYEDFYHHLRMEMDEYRRLKRSLRVLKSYTDYEEDLYEEAV